MWIFFFSFEYVNRKILCVGVVAVRLGVCVAGVGAVGGVCAPAGGCAGAADVAESAVSSGITRGCCSALLSQNTAGEWKRCVYTHTHRELCV